MNDEYTPMLTLDAWRHINNFQPEGSVDNFGDPWGMDYRLIETVDAMRDYAGVPFFVHCGMEPRAAGYHPEGMALDGHFQGLHPLEMFEIAQRFDRLNGIGVYMYWNWQGKICGGIHVDTRPKRLGRDFDARWGCFEKGQYVKIDIGFIRKAAAITF